MKIDSELRNRIKIMREHEIPKEKRREYIENTRGFCGIVSGARSIMHEAINYICEHNIRGDDAVKYIYRKMG